MSSKIKFIIFSVVLISIFVYLDDNHSKKIDDTIEVLQNYFKY